MNHFNALTAVARPSRHAAQRGVSLIFALLALGAMLLAAVALVRAVDSGALVLGNLGFKQDATSAADRAAEYARTCLNGGGGCAVIANLNADGAIGTGYYASSQVAGALPAVLALAAGALLYLTCNEVIPESHSHGNEVRATFGVLAGFVIIMVVQAVFGHHH